MTLHSREHIATIYGYPNIIDDVWYTFFPDDIELHASSKSDTQRSHHQKGETCRNLRALGNLRLDLVHNPRLRECAKVA